MPVPADAIRDAYLVAWLDGARMFIDARTATDDAKLDLIDEALTLANQVAPNESEHPVDRATALGVTEGYAAVATAAGRAHAAAPWKSLIRR